MATPLKCDLCGIIIGEGYVYEHPIRIKVEDKWFNVDEDCFKELQKHTGIKKSIKYSLLGRDVL